MTAPFRNRGWSTNPTGSVSRRCEIRMTVTSCSAASRSSAAVMVRRGVPTLAPIPTNARATGRLVVDVYRLEVVRLDALKPALLPDLPILEPERACAQARQHRVIVPSRDHHTSRVQDFHRALVQEIPELVVEGLVDLVEQEDLGVRLFGDGETQSGLHSLRVRQHRSLECFVKTTARLHVLERADRLRPRETGDYPEQHRILAASEQGQQTGVHRQHGSDAPIKLHTTLIGRKDTREDAQQRRLAGAAPPD